MHCPRCGTPNEPGDKFCSACGAALREPSTPQERLSPRGADQRALGTTRKAQLVTAATVAALVTAVIAFIALKPAEDTIPRDAYTIAADRLCLDAKSEIVAVERRFSRQTGPHDTSTFAGNWCPLSPPGIRNSGRCLLPKTGSKVHNCWKRPLLEAEVQIAGLARVATRGGKKKTLESAKQADAASAGVEEAVSALGLSRCAAATIGFTLDSN